MINHQLPEDISSKIAELDLKIELEPKMSFNYFRRAHLKSKLDDFESALIDCNMAIEISPDNDYYYTQRACIKTRLNDHEGAINDCSIAIDKNPSSHYAFFYRGNAKRKNKDINDAIDDFTKSITLKQEDHLSYLFLAAIYLYDLKDYEKALFYYDKVIELGNQEENTLKSRSLTLKKLEEKENPEVSTKTYLQFISMTISELKKELKKRNHQLKNADKEQVAFLTKEVEMVTEMIKRKTLNTILKKKNPDLSFMTLEDLDKNMMRFKKFLNYVRTEKNDVLIELYIKRIGLLKEEIKNRKKISY